MKAMPEFLTKVPSLYVKTAFFLLTVCFVFYDPLMSIVSSWQKEEYSYAYLVPPLALLLGLHRLSKNPLRPNSTWWGVAVVVLGVAFHLLGKLSGVTVFPQYGFFIALLGVCLTFGGWKIFVLLLPVLGYLFFAIPLPTTVYITLSAKLQLLSSELGSELLQWLGFSVYQEGNIIDLGVYKLQVVEACSGLRYIFPLLGFSYLVAYLFNDRLWKRIVVFVSALPIAVMLNVLRISVVGSTVNIWGTTAAEGVLHEFEGWVIFSICVLLLFGEVFLLQGRGASKGHLDLSCLSLPRGPFFSRPFANTKAAVAVFGLLLLVGVGQATGVIAPHEELIPQRRDFASFPLEVNQWQAVRERLTTDEVELLKMTDYLSLNLTQPEKEGAVNFFVAYYGSQRNKNDLHSPEMCIPGSGWKVLSSSTYRLKLATDSQRLFVDRVLIQKGLSRELVYYWFEQSGRSWASRLAIKGQTIMNSLTTGRTDSALLRLTTTVLPNESEADADERLQSFFRDALPLLPDYIPDFRG